MLDAMDADGPVLVHCSAGADRTGLAVAAYRVRRQGWSVERALAEMERYWAESMQAPAENVLRLGAGSSRAVAGDAG